MGRAPALEVMLSAEDYDAEQAERYGWINRALPADALGDFVSSLAHRIAGFPAAGHVVVKDRVNAIALAPAEDFRRDSDLFGEGVRNPWSSTDPWPSSVSFVRAAIGSASRCVAKLREAVRRVALLPRP